MRELARHGGIWKLMRRAGPVLFALAPAVVSLAAVVLWYWQRRLDGALLCMEYFFKGATVINVLYGLAVALLANLVNPYSGLFFGALFIVLEVVYVLGVLVVMLLDYLL
jgi:hypothetical protein